MEEDETPISLKSASQPSSNNAENVIFSELVIPPYPIYRLCALQNVSPTQLWTMQRLTQVYPDRPPGLWKSYREGLQGSIKPGAVTRGSCPAHRW